MKIGMAIRRQSLQALEQECEGSDGSADHDRPRPSDTDQQRECEKAEEVVHLPTEPGAKLQFRRAKSGK
jgi:hypothetical protein